MFYEKSVTPGLDLKECKLKQGGMNPCDPERQKVQGGVAYDSEACGRN